MATVELHSRRYMTKADRQHILRLRYRDGFTQAEVARITGRNRETVRLIAPGRVGKIDNARLREAFAQSGLTAAEVARRLGWRAGTSWDGSRVNRWLGVTLDRSGTRKARSYRRLIDAETAGLIAEAIGVEPWEIGALD